MGKELGKAAKAARESDKPIFCIATGILDLLANNRWKSCWKAEKLIEIGHHSRHQIQPSKLVHLASMQGRQRGSKLLRTTRPHQSKHPKKLPVAAAVTADVWPVAYSIGLFSRFRSLYKLLLCKAIAKSTRKESTKLERCCIPSSHLS